MMMLREVRRRVVALERGHAVCAECRRTCGVVVVYRAEPDPAELDDEPVRCPVCGRERLVIVTNLADGDI